MGRSSFENVNIEDLVPRLDEILVRDLPVIFTIDPSEEDRLALIVSSSDEIIISKTLDGIVTSWNASATRILGYEESEMIGKSILEIIPPELHEEEKAIMETVLRGERVEPFVTERLCKDGSRVRLSLTVSPLRDHSGHIVGASKIARLATGREQTADLHTLLFKELDHRAKNTLMILQHLERLSVRTSPTMKELADAINGQVVALVRAHELLGSLLVTETASEVSLAELVSEQVVMVKNDPRIHFVGPDISLKPDAAVEVVLLLRALAKRAKNEGALSVPTGTLAITWNADDSRKEIVIGWREGGVVHHGHLSDQDTVSALIKDALAKRGGSVTEEVGPDGFSCEIRLPVANGRLEGQAVSSR